MPRTSTRNCWSRVVTSTALPCVARPGRARAGRRKWTGRIRSTSSRWIGPSSGSAARRANGRPPGGSTVPERAAAPLSWSSPGKTVRRVPRGRSAPGRNSGAVACGCRPRRNMRRLKRHGPGMPAGQGSSAISGGPESKGRCPRACAAVGCGARDTEGLRKLISNTWRRPRRSIWIDSWRGSTSARERGPAPRASPRWRLPAAGAKAPQRSATPPDLLSRVLGCDVSSPGPFSNTKIISVVSDRMSEDHGLAMPGQLPHKVSPSSSRQGWPTVSVRLMRHPFSLCNTSPAPCIPVSRSRLINHNPIPDK